MSHLLWNELSIESKPVASAPRPVLKWAGGKQQMLDVLLQHIPQHYNRYIEPFFGGGVLFFALRPTRAVIECIFPNLLVANIGVQRGNPALRGTSEDREELADIVIYCLNFANQLNIDVTEAVMSKLDGNRVKYPVDKVKSTTKKYTEL